VGKNFMRVTATVPDGGYTLPIYPAMRGYFGLPEQEDP
jgi:hypothetical protein